MRLWYKCRRCERKFYAGDDVGKTEAQQRLENKIVMHVIGTAPPDGKGLLTVHVCDSHSLGIADLLGSS